MAQATGELGPEMRTQSCNRARYLKGSDSTEARAGSAWSTEAFNTMLMHSAMTMPTRLTIATAGLPLMSSIYIVTNFPYNFSILTSQ